MCLSETLMNAAALVLCEQVLNAQSRNIHHPAGLLALKTKNIASLNNISPNS